jgi:uncharacterized protein YcbX
VVALRRYPVKSLAGEDLPGCGVEARGLVGDRLWSVRDHDGRFGSAKTTRRFRRMPGLLELDAEYDPDVPVVVFPDGRRVRGDDPSVDSALSEHVGRPVSLAREMSVSHFDEGPVHLVTTAALRAVERAHGRPVDWRRCRANVLVEQPGDGLVEHTWVGADVALGSEVMLRVRGTMPRCLTVDAAQEDLATDGRLLRTITDLSDGLLGVVADVLHGGVVAVGARVEVRQ